jgi:hypothetical protein
MIASSGRNFFEAHIPDAMYPADKAKNTIDTTGKKQPIMANIALNTVDAAMDAF